MSSTLGAFRRSQANATFAGVASRRRAVCCTADEPLVEQRRHGIDLFRERDFGIRMPSEVDERQLAQFQTAEVGLDPWPQLLWALGREPLALGPATCAHHGSESHTVDRVPGEQDGLVFHSHPHRSAGTALDTHTFSQHNMYLDAGSGVLPGDERRATGPLAEAGFHAARAPDLPVLVEPARPVSVVPGQTQLRSRPQEATWPSTR
jgi:hypothetical protein